MSSDNDVVEPSAGGAGWALVRRPGRPRLGRVVLLAVRHVLATSRRATLLVLMTVVGLLIFLVVDGLSRASRQQLGDAITAELGVEGSYRVTVPADLGVGAPALSDAIVRQSRAAGATSVLVVAEMGSIDPSCPLTDASARDEQSLFVVLRAESVELLLPRRPPSGHAGDSSGYTTEICLFGRPLDADASLAGALANRAGFPEEMSVLRDDLFAEAILAVGPPSTVTAVVGFDPEHRTVDIEGVVRQALAPSAARFGLGESWSESVTASRLDGGEGVRAAEAGVSLVYQILAWGVLVLGGLGLLVAQLMSAQSRTWFFGLARVVGARRRDLATMVMVEVMVLVVVAVAIALALAAALQPTLTAWSEATFEVELTVIELASLPRLALAAGLLSLVAGGYPAVRSTRMDPADVLER
jgi:hypothetical protein